MERITNEVLVTELGDFNWEVLEEPSPEQEQEEEVEEDDFSDLLGGWGVNADGPAAVEKSKQKEVVEEVPKKRSRGHKRKADAGDDGDMEAEVVEVPGPKEQRKKAKVQGENKDVEMDDPDYDFGTMGVTATDPTPHHRTPCKQCEIANLDCFVTIGLKGNACVKCRSRKIGCSFVNTPGVSGNRLTSNPMPKKTTSKKPRELTPPIVLITAPPKKSGKPAGKEIEAKDARPRPRATKPPAKTEAVTQSGGSRPPPAKDDARGLIHPEKTTVYANSRYTGPNQIPEKSVAEVIVPDSPQEPKVAIRVTRASRRQMSEPEVSVTKGRVRDGSVRPGHDGETASKSLYFSMEIHSDLTSPRGYICGAQGRLPYAHRPPGSIHPSSRQHLDNRPPAGR